MKRLTVALFLAGLAVVGLAGAPQLGTPPPKPHVLVPVSGTWTADYENAQQILTINGAAPPTAPNAEAAASLFGAQAPQFVKALAVPGAYPLAVARDVRQMSSGRARVEFRLISGATDQTAGLMFNLKPDGSYVYARYNTKDGNVAVWKVENGARAVLQHGERHEQLPMGGWHSLVVEINGTALTASVDDRLTVRYTLPEPVNGRVGVWTKTDSVTAFRRFTVSHGGHRMHR